MKLERNALERLIFGTERFQRFTQDSPVMPDVWLAYGEQPEETLALLLTPHMRASAAKLGLELRNALKERNTVAERKPAAARVAYNEAYVLAELDFEELIQVALPLTHWWRAHLWRGKLAGDVGDLRKASVRTALVERCRQQAGEEALDDKLSPDLVWLVRIVGAIVIGKERQDDGAEEADVEAATRVLADARVNGIPREPMLWRVSQNREARFAISKSLLAVKADAATRLFDLDCRNLTWAVIDSGIDATHPAFRKRDSENKDRLLAEPFVKQDGVWQNNTRIVATYDFTRLREYLNPEAEIVAGRRLTEEERNRALDFRTALENGRAIDWDALEPLLRVPHDGTYAKDGVPATEHGTHVAGILTADWRTSDKGVNKSPEDHDLYGVARGLELYDLRVFDAEGRGNEFDVIAALQFIRHLNAHGDVIAVHGVNLSLSIRHDVMNYACGRTPVCEECERLVGTGTVVVAAAGNYGFARYLTVEADASEAYRNISIVDPGNAQGVITVGATHRYKPQTYGVSYFSSRGPTGDGRIKPDLVAPGEKIVSPIPDRRVKSMDGTSMAAPHVSAAAALLMARYDELIGKPEEIKRVLCETATDLGRERYFQGSGMLDILRALQSV